MVLKLRIAVSVFFGLLTVALCVLWVRSYSARERLTVPLSIEPMSDGYFIGATSALGDLVMYFDKCGQGEFCQLGVSSVRFGANPHDIWGGVAEHFYFSRKDGGFYAYVAAPFWMLVSANMLTIVAAWKVRRFSLRTLLIATTLVAAVLGLAVWAGSN